MTQTATPVALATLDDLIQRAGGGNPIRVAVVNAAQAAVLETLREAARELSSSLVYGGQKEGWRILLIDHARSQPA